MVALSWVQVANFLFPLVTVPYLARVLGPHMWGVVAVAQAFGQYLMLGVNYGFELSATRDVARAGESDERRAGLLSEILGAKLVLASLAVFVAFLGYWVVPILRDNPAVAAAGASWGLTSAFGLTWYFQGLERMKLVAVLEVGTKAASILAILWFVRVPSDAWLVLALMSLAGLLSAVTASAIAFREVGYVAPTIAGTFSALRRGWSLFVFRGSVSLYTVANVLILGMFATASVVGFYAAAEKIVRAVLGLLTPVSKSLYPRVSSMLEESRIRAAKLVRQGTIAVGVTSVAVAGILAASAPWVVGLLFGPEYSSTVIVLRILVLTIPAVGVSNMLGVQWMLPLGLDRIASRIIIAAGVLNLVLAITLVPSMLEVGMAIAVVCTEVFVTAAIWVILRRGRLDPFRLAAKAVS